MSKKEKQLELGGGGDSHITSSPTKWTDNIGSQYIIKPPSDSILYYNSHLLLSLQKKKLEMEYHSLLPMVNTG